MKIKKSESGQVLYLLVFGIISLIGFTALAIDGGRLYSERRMAQGVADSASFTGAVYLARAPNITATEMNNAEISANQIAIENGYDDADPDVSVTVSVDQQGFYYLVTTTITSEIDPTFAQLVYNDPLQVSVQALTRVLPLGDAVFGNAITSLNTSDCDALKFSGDTWVDIDGSGIFSNSSGSSSSCAGISFEGSNWTDIEGCVSTAGVVNEGSGAVTYGCKDESVPPIPEFYIPIPDCTGMPAVTMTWVDATHVKFTPGITYAPILINSPGVTFTFQEGLYCINDASGFKVNSGIVENGGSGVMFYVKGVVDISGGYINLAAPTDSSIVDSSGEVWDGMLFYVPDGYDVTLNGNTNSYLQGTIYAPKSFCKLNGSGSTTAVDLSLVCDTIDLLGNSELFIDFHDANQYIPPTNLDLMK